LATLLYITAHPLDHQMSYSLAVGKAFVDAYKEKHPQDHVVHLDLYKLGIPHIDADVFSGWGQLRSGAAFDKLPESEKSKITKLNELVDQFVAADKYVFVTPMWNLSFPPVLKAYIDAICIAGKTFKYTEQGPAGLLNNKQAFHIQARGGIYSEGPAAALESGHSYLVKILNFIGISQVDAIFVEGMSAFPDKAEDIKQKAIAEAKEKAARFSLAGKA
jgi:FMN-dependent NADH-azoreductase